ncbi:NADP-dependent aldehyde dehydrogenase [Pseudomonas taetrolens]|uniref:Aldehyde dehydrogenase n=1 Tax=Pseudomonas taetrolens TaxID=47884 RepID=A0A0J6GSI9_PSETA|nr:aldehyde dehydrogenase (NADP(+)) [Pseudomonas taetrolens]KMM85348.1 aldehyde dehydrogenase [Pseudomonas taetrolens]SEC34994.1 NADP-dependent aldehyde dehydrogenase [Pseudomonas taetrolens]SQF86400.1 aldehyde dehydrogenase [Pseudomonas taetrolens]VEH49477.1 aldehyde dehydrogenase [Pseudomonas taetrolens]
MSEYSVVDAAVAQAHAAAPLWAQASATVRASLLRGLAEALEAQKDSLIALADEETHLGAGRLGGEIARTAFQLRGFADGLSSGPAYTRVVDEAVAGTPPAGRPQLTRVLRPLGPVAMFSASNFPFAFSVLGGDTASALAAGCPVVVKAHSGHPRLSQVVLDLAREVVRAQGLPEGLLTLVDNASRGAGGYLVQHPDIAAVAFTGSFQGGTALWKLANERSRPVPFFGELGSINPLVALPAALEQNSAELANTLATSITMGCGQFCTSPGLIVVLDSTTSERFIGQLCEALAPIQPHAMLTPGMRQGFEAASAHVAGHATTLLAPGPDAHGPAPRVYATDAVTFIQNPALREEMFGPGALVVKARDQAQVHQVLQAVGGTLTTTLWGANEDTPANRALVQVAEAVSGRVLFTGVPTGVAVCAAQQHGGPWPSSTTPQTTSVGYAAIERFLRPVALQDAPAWAQA